MKQTAVEWLGNELDNILPEMYPSEWDKLEIAIKKAKEMEKEQIIDAWVDGDNSDCLSEQDSSDFAERYYNETFNSNG